MPNKFGTLFSKLEQKFEEAKISDLNHELGKWVQGTSTAFVDNFRGQSRPKFGQKPGGSGLPKSLSLPSFSAAVQAAGPTHQTHVSQPGNKKYLYKSGAHHHQRSLESGGKPLSNQKLPQAKESFFDEVDESLLRGEDLAHLDFSNSEHQSRSEVVEKFIRVIENKEPQGLVPQVPRPPLANTKREDILKRLSFGGDSNEQTPESNGEGFATLNQKGCGKQKGGGGDLEVCYINETILEEEGDEEEEEVGSDFSGTQTSLGAGVKGRGPVEESEEEEEEYEYEEDYRSSLPPTAAAASRIPRSKTDWEVFKGAASYPAYADGDSVEDQPYSSASPPSSPVQTSVNPGGISAAFEDSPPNRLPPTTPVGGARGEAESIGVGRRRGDLQAEAALALSNCHKIARRKLLISKAKEVQSDENKLEKLLGRKIPRDEATGRFTTESLCNLNNPTLQVIVNDLHSKIERLNENLVFLVIEKDELQIEQDSQLVDIDDLQVPHQRRF